MVRCSSRQAAQPLQTSFQRRSELSVTRPFDNKVSSLLAAIALYARVRGQSDCHANAVTVRCTFDNSHLHISIFDFVRDSNMILGIDTFRLESSRTAMYTLTRRSNYCAARAELTATGLLCQVWKLRGELEQITCVLITRAFEDSF